MSGSHPRPDGAFQEISEDATHKEIKQRKIELDQSDINQYPRVHRTGNEICLKHYVHKYSGLKPGQKHEASGPIRVAGRVTAIRKSGAKLAFLDVYEEPGHHKIQLMLNLAQMDGIEKKAFSDHVKLITRGDVISATGIPTRTTSGELSLLANALPQILSPCLHQMPLTSYQSQSMSEIDIDILDRHVEMLTDPSMVSTMVARSKLIKTMRDFFDSQDFMEVQTPILAAAAGGATARPFETIATESSDRKLWLRIAPELWLKRLILGGLSRIYEIGPSFRNEGLDKSHNPEFTSCEFYAAHYDLSQLQRTTEDLLRSISQTIQSLNQSNLNPPSPSWFNNTFAEIDFIPALNTALGQPLPNLTTPTSQAELLEIFKSHSIPIPFKPTLPRLLDKLCSHYLEPSCTKPTWIINTPECLSPLAKSFIHPTCPNNQPVAARAELFINNREIVNCYEEENSPFEQRRKFIDQQRLARPTGPNDQSFGVDDEAHKIDHDYLRALEWGLQPTGGWGCGIDRLVMLFTGKERIGDVLSFGNLRAVTRGADRWNMKSPTTKSGSGEVAK